MISSRIMSAVPNAWTPWYIVVVLLVGQLSHTFTNQGIPTLYPFIQDAMRLSRAEVGLISSGMILGATFTTLIAGWLVDALGVKRMMTSMALCGAVTVVLFSQAQNLLQAILLVTLMSAVYAGMAPSCVKAIIDWVKPRNRGLARGIQQTTVPIAGVITALLLPPLAEAFDDWRKAVLVLALMVVAAGSVVFIFFRDNPQGVSVKGTRKGVVGDIAVVARNRDIWLVCLCATCLTSLNHVFIAYLILFLNEELGMTVVLAGVFLAVSQGSAAIGRIAWGSISDFVLGGRRVVGMALMGVLSVLSMALMVWLPSDSSVIVVGVVVSVVAVSHSGFPVLNHLLLADLAGPGLTGTVIGFMGLIMHVGSFGFPPLFGLVADRTGSYDASWWMMAGVVALGTMFLFFLRPEARRR